MKTEISFGVVVAFKEKSTWYFVLVKTNHWGFPKGHPDLGESEFETAAREVFEETGIAITTIVPNILFKETYVVSKKDKKPYQKDVVYFLAVIDKKLEAKAQNEVCEVAWLSYEEAKIKITYHESQVLLDEVYEWLLKNR